MLLKLKPPTQKNYLDIAMIKFITKLSPNYKNNYHQSIALANEMKNVLFF
jgi:hypothetical protein